MKLETLEDTCTEHRIVKIAVEYSGEKRSGQRKKQFALDWALAEFDKLDATGKMNVLWEAAVNFSCRTGKNAEKLQGKVLSLLETAAYLALAPQRGDAKPNKQDIADAEQLMVVLKKDAHKQAHDIDENDPLYGDVDAFIVKLVQAVGDKAKARHDGLAWTYNDDLPPLENLQWMHRAARLWKPRLSSYL